MFPFHPPVFDGFSHAQYNTFDPVFREGGFIVRFSKSLIPTLKEDPREAELVSHRLLLRAGFLRSHGSGVFQFLPLGWKVIQRIARIIREEMDRIGAQEVLLPSLTLRDVWEESGRWEDFGPDMFRLKDRKGRDLALAPTHEELITLLARQYFRSYRDLPQILYQIQTKFRDEPRPRGGVLRGREFLMKDSYSFDPDWEGLKHSYQLHDQAYRKIFDRAGLKYVVVSASSGLMGGSASEEYMVLSDAGEDTLVLCEQCGYAANQEVAEGTREETPLPDSPFASRERVATPNVRSVEEVAAFLNVPVTLIIKGLVYVTPRGLWMVLIRGNRDVSESKLQKLAGGVVRMATPEEVRERFGVPIGFVGPLGAPADVTVVADLSVQGIRGGVVGGMQEDTHWVGVTPGEDFAVEQYADLALVREGDRCVKCGAPLTFRSAIEIGHIFQLGTKYSEAMGAYFTDRDGQEKPIVMGSYGIGLARIMASAVELYADEHGIRWPQSIAPMDVHLVDLFPKSAPQEGERLYRELRERGLDVLWDERPVSPGVKFKDADLMGIPYRVVLGEKALQQGEVEIQNRWTGERTRVPRADTVPRLLDMLAQEPTDG